jgi:hypothetical protein
MRTFLLAIGAIAAAVGVFTIGFGIEIYDFSFGNTLIIAGTTSLIGGMIIVALAVAVRELTRIADAVSARTPSRQALRADATDPTDTAANNGRRNQSNRPAFPTKGNPEGAARELRSEPRLAPVPTPEDLDETPVVRPRQNIYPLVRPAAEPRLVEDLDSVPLSPHAPSRAPKAARAENARSENTFHAKASEQPATASKPNQVKASESKAASAGGQSAVLEVPRTVPAASRQHPERAERANLFDSVWPADAKPRTQFANEAVARDLNPAPAEGARENVELIVPLPKREEVVRAQSEPRPVSILKSGVIDGMAYTLYTDGSIEAQLSQNTMRFNSIDELREHLENSA